MNYSLDTAVPHLLNGKPAVCHWCNGSLARLRNIYKGIQCERYYCSRGCLSQGEDRAVRYRATLAGRVCSPWYVALAALLAVFILGFTVHPKARAHSPDTHTADGLATAKSDKYGLCCDGTDYIRINTWEPTATGYRVMYRGKWLEAPRSVKVNNMDNPDGEAKAWIHGPPEAPYVRCFMAGTLG